MKLVLNVKYSFISDFVFLDNNNINFNFIITSSHYFFLIGIWSKTLVIVSLIQNGNLIIISSLIDGSLLSSNLPFYLETHVNFTLMLYLSMFLSRLATITFTWLALFSFQLIVITLYGHCSVSQSLSRITALKSLYLSVILSLLLLH